MKIATSLLIGAGAVAAASARAPHDLDYDSLLNRDLPPHEFHHMGQYSPRFNVPSEIAPAVQPPAGCRVVFVDSLERHGARHFTAGAYKKTKASLAKIQAALQDVRDDELADPSLAFFRNLTLATTTDSLVPYGALQSYYSGRSTREVYRQLSHLSPFVRASGDEDLGDDRVIVTAKYWRLGFSGQPFPSGTFTTSQEIREVPGLQEPDVVFSEQPGQNNTLDVSTCTAENNLSPDPESHAQALYGNSTVVPTIDLLNIMNICSFETLGNANITDGKLQLALSPVCGAFNATEWEIYGYANSAGKYYGAGYGDPYYKALGKGFLRELYARLNGSAPGLAQPTSLNSTIDGTNFPLPSPRTHQVYFDGSHDNNIGPIAAAFGLLAGPALGTGAHAEQQQHAWDFAKIAPLQGKIVFEKLECAARRAKRGRLEEQTPLNAAGPLKHAYLRVRANGAVQSPVGATWCPSSGKHGRFFMEHGLCPLESVLDALAWVNTDRQWNTCFSS